MKADYLPITRHLCKCGVTFKSSTHDRNRVFQSSRNFCHNRVLESNNFGNELETRVKFDLERVVSTWFLSLILSNSFSFQPTLRNLAWIAYTTFVSLFKAIL